MGLLELFSVIRLRKFLILWAVLVAAATATLAGILLPEKYVSTATVQVDSIQRNTLTGLVEPRVRVAEFLGQQAAVAGSRTVALEVIDSLAGEGYFAMSDFEARWREETGGELVPGNDARLWAADQLLKNLTIEADALESTLDISFRGDDAAQTARITNAFANAYMSTVLDQKKRQYARNAASFTGQTQEFGQGVIDAQAKLAEFREKSGILPLGEQGVEAIEVELASLTARLAEAQADRAEANSLLRQALATPRAELINFPLPEDALPARQAQVRLGAVTAQLNRIAERYGEQYPDYVEVAREKRLLESNILESIRNRAEYADRRVAALSQATEDLKSDVVEMQSTKEAYDLLEKRVAASQETFDLVTTRSLQESLQSRVDNIIVLLLARAVPSPKPATPPLPVIVVIGVVVGAVLGACAAVLVEFLEGRLRSPDALRHALQTGVTAEIDAPRPANENKAKEKKIRAGKINNKKPATKARRKRRRKKRTPGGKAAAA